MASAQFSVTQIGLISLLTGPREFADGRACAPAEQADRWEQVTDELLRLRQLEEDWDGQGASAPDPVNVDCAIEWLQQMRPYAQAIPPTQVVPGVTGEVLLVWQGVWEGQSLFLEAEIAAPQRIEWMLAVPGQPTRQWVTGRDSLYFVGAVR